MKKTISLVLAVIISAIAICAMSTVAFGVDPDDDMPFTTTTTAPTTTTTTAPTTTTTTAAPATTSTTAATTSANTDSTAIDPSKLQEDLSNLIGGLTTKPTLPEVTATTKEGETFFVDKSTTKAPAPATTKKPAPVASAIPNTGSTLAIPAVALLVLAAGTIAVIKTKEDK